MSFSVLYHTLSFIMAFDCYLSYSYHMRGQCQVCKMKKILLTPDPQRDAFVLFLTIRELCIARQSSSTVLS